MYLFSAIGVIGFACWSMYGFAMSLSRVIIHHDKKKKVHIGYAILAVGNLCGVMMFPVAAQLIYKHGLVDWF